MYVVMNVLEVPAAAKDHMAGMFSRAAENMKRVPGCIEFQYLDSTAGDKQIVYTKWESEEAFSAWRNSDAFMTAHSSARPGSSPATGSHIETYTVVHHT